MHVKRWHGDTPPDIHIKMSRLRFHPQLKPAGGVCRTSAGQCDLAEYCTGASEQCPEDSFEMNGKPCYNQAEGFCHDGQCPTHQQHCWRVFGPGNGPSRTALQLSSSTSQRWTQTPMWREETPCCCV